MGLRPRYRHLLQNWHVLVLTAVILLVLLLGYQSTTPYERNNTLQQQQLDRNNNDSSDLALQDAIATDLYAIEEAAAQLFPAYAQDILEMLEQQREEKENIPKWQKWLLPSDNERQPIIEFLDAFSTDGNCENEPLPLPVLRRVIADSQDIKDDQTFPEPILLIPRAARFMCIRAVIPPLLELSSTSVSSVQENPYHYLYQPFLLHQRNLTSPWWDSLLVSAQHIETGSSLPLRMQPWSGHKTLRDEWRKRTLDNNKPAWVHDREQWMHERLMLHVYEASVTLHDPGHYKFEGRLEYQDGLWNFEKGPIVPYKPQMMQIISAQELPITVGEPHGTLEDIVQQHLQLPLCAGADHPGRWLPAPPGLPDLVTDKDGKFWAPFDCRYQRISYSDFAECLAEKYPAGIDMYGDSNTRRSIKKMVTGGRWCDGWHGRMVAAMAASSSAEREQQRQKQDDKETPINNNLSSDPYDWSLLDDDNKIQQLRSCHCEDFHEPGWNPSWFDAQDRRNAVRLRNSTGHERALLRSYKWDGLTYLNDPSWTTAFTTINATFDISHPSDVVIFSLGNWDAAYMSLYEFNKELDKLLNYVATTYANKQIIYRTPQYYCCRADNTKRNRLLSSSRVQAFNDLAKSKFVRVLGARVWDTMVLGESRTWHEKLQARDCPSNHATPDVVEIENQILMNALCNA